MDEQIIHSVNRKLDQMIEQGREVIDQQQIQKQLERGREQLRSQIRRYPIGSVVAGLTIGFLCSRMCRR